MKPLTKRERSLVAVGLLVLALGLVWLLVIGPLVGGFFDRAEQRRELRATYARNTRLVASIPVLRAEAEAQAATASRFATTAPSQALAVEALKERLQRLSTDQGFILKTVDDLQSDTPRGSIKLRADLTLTLSQLCETLRRLQSEDAYVVIDSLSISADRSFAAGRLEPLDVRIEVSGLWRAGRIRS